MPKDKAWQVMMALRRNTKSDKDELLACEAAGGKPTVELKDGVLKGARLRNSRDGFQKSKKKQRKSKAKRAKQTAKVRGAPHNDEPSAVERSTIEPIRRNSRLAKRVKHNWRDANNARLETLKEKRDFLLTLQGVKEWSQLWDWCRDAHPDQYPSYVSMSFDMQQQACLDALLENHVCVICVKVWPCGAKVVKCLKCMRWAELACVKEKCEDFAPKEDVWICQHCAAA